VKNKIKHMNKIFCIIGVSLVLISCKTTFVNKDIDKVTYQKDVYKNETQEIASWLVNFEPLETIRIGPEREYTSLDDYFSKNDEPSNVFILVEEGTYYTDNSIWVRGDNIIVEGVGEVHIYCNKLYSCVMDVTGENILIKNLHMQHTKPGEPEHQNCSGRVILFDNANNCVIENCDLNGCGLAGLHDNLGNSAILVRNCYIHNNSLGAYTDIDGGVWQEAIDDHPVFTFENNKIENNGPDRVPE